MAQNRSSKSGSSSFLAIAVFVLFIVAGVSFYLNSQSLKRIEQLESSYQSVINRMAELEFNGGNREDGDAPARRRDVIAIEQTGTVATIKESINKVLSKSEFSVEGLIYCSPAEEVNDVVTKVEVLYFRGGLVSFFSLSPNTAITPKTLVEGRGKYTINGLDILASVVLDDAGTQLLSLKITELTTDQKGVLGLTLSDGVTWRSSDCEALGIVL